MTRSATSGGTIKVGSIAPLTGVLAFDGNELKNGIKLAEEEINQRGGVLICGKRHKLQVIYGDDEGNAAVSKSVLMKMIESEEIDVAVGHLKSTAFMAIIDTYEKKRIPVVDVAAAAGSIYERIATEKMKYVFQASPAGSDITDSLVEPVGHWFNPQKVAVCAENQEGGRQTGTQVREWAVKNGVEIVAEEYLPLEETDFRTVLSAIRASEAEVVFLHINGEAPNAALFESMYEIKIPAVVSHIGITVISDNFRKIHARALESSFAVVRFVLGKRYTHKTQDFYDHYKAVFGHDPVQWGIQAYDSLHIMADAIQRADSLDPEAIAKALEETQYTGAWKKNWTFELGTHRSRASLAVSQFQGGKLVPIWPLDIAEKFNPVPPYSWQKI